MAALRPDYPVRTSRLALRPLREGDATALLAYTSAPELCRYVPWGPFRMEDVLERIRGAYSRTELTEPGTALVLGVVLGDDRVVGHVMVRWHSEEHRDGEVGWVLSPEVQGRGLATEASHAALHLAFDGLGLHRVVARIEVRNGPSIAVAERLGMRCEARLVENEWMKGEWASEVDYALLDREWRASHAVGCPFAAAP